MLKRMPERALKSRESFQVSFSAAGKIRIAEKALRFRRLAGFPDTALRLPLAMLAMRLALHALNKVSLLAEGFGKAHQPPKPPARSIEEKSVVPNASESDLAQGTTPRLRKGIDHEPAYR